jgi:hypothetical protein
MPDIAIKASGRRALRERKDDPPECSFWTSETQCWNVSVKGTDIWNLNADQLADFR